MRRKERKERKGIQEAEGRLLRGQAACCQDVESRHCILILF